ncbi:MAG: M14 family zinc carboxypeptidase [Chloroflexota bacterium]
MRRHIARLAAIVAMAALLAPAAPAAASSAPPSPAGPDARLVGAATKFTGSWSAYHTYAEMVAEIKAVAAAHPDLVQLSVIGKSYQGRNLWLAKVSQDVTTDHGRPEVLFEGGTHALEHMGVEMTIRLLHWLADGYGSDTRITKIVNSRTVWILFNLNPDGSEFDSTGSAFRSWRKNRQPNANGTVGTDLNRNWNYRWGCCGLVSATPASAYYRGRTPFSAPEAEALRAFIASRVVNGRQAIRTAVDFHESGRFVLWPYDYTKANVPADMTSMDRSVLSALGKRMAASNGYKPMQSSDMYIDSGTLTDWLYGKYRTFAYTIEMGVNVYRTNAVMLAEVNRNRGAALALAEAAGCPYSLLGAAYATARCGAFDDDMEASRAWATNPDGTDTAAAAGAWKRGAPAKVAAGGITLQPGTVPTGRYAMVTGLAAGATAGDGDLDGTTTLRSVPVTLPAGAGQQLAFHWFFGHLADSTADDHLRAIVEDAGGTQTVVWEQAGAATKQTGAWAYASVSLDAWAGQTIRLRFEASDGADDSTVEAGIDDVRVTRPS